MTINYKITFRDTVSSFYFLACKDLLSTRGILLYLVPAFGALWFIYGNLNYIYWEPGHGQEDMTIGVGFFIIGLFINTLLWLKSYFFVKRVSNGTKYAAASLNISETGIDLNTGLFQQSYQWIEIYKTIRNQRLLLFFLSTDMYITVPLYQLSTEQKVGFIDMLQQYLGRLAC